MKLGKQIAPRGSGPFLRLSSLSDLFRISSFGFRIFLFLVAARARAELLPILDAEHSSYLGAAGGGKWVPFEKAKGLIKGGETYRLYSLTAALGTAKGGKPESAGEPCPDVFTVALKPKPAGAVIGLAGAWNALPRVPKALDVTQPVYQKAVADFLTTQGLRAPQVRITQILRIDLDGDREDEVLIAATNYFAGDGHIPANTKAGSYSCVLLRRVVAGKVETQLVAGEFYPKAATFNAPNGYTVTAVLDLDGDGKMEVIVNSAYYEGGACTVFRCTGKKPEQVLSVGCGA